MENKYFLTDDQLEVQALAKDFADNTVAKTVRELDEAHAFPMEEVKQCGELGFLGGCVQQDGMQQIYESIRWCDRVVFATPVYFWNISGQMKCIIDRLYAMGKPSDRGYFSYPVRHCALLATSADTEKHFWVFESVRQYFERLTDYLRWERDGMLFAGNCGGTKFPRRIEETKWLEKAYEMGLHG